MAKINTIIPTQGFELVRDRIAQILAVEMAEQYILTNDPDLDISKVYIERTNSVDKTECPVMNISLSNGAFDNWTQQSTGGVYHYYIDIYTNAKSADGNAGEITGGDTISNIKLQKILGKCRAILENTAFYTLLFDPPFIRSVYNQEFGIKPLSKDDDMSPAMARLVFVVSLTETNELPEAGEADEVLTKVKLGLSDHGYYWENTTGY